MNYLQAINFLYSSAPMFQQVGQQGYKTGLENTVFLDKYFGYPHRKYRTIHVGGTNGKGSTSHLLAAILQNAGYKTGLYTSPHLKDFRERIKVNGKMISKHRVTTFIRENQNLIKEISPSFFEITTSLAFQFFAEQNVDIAVVEVGLGGRLDCTNIISPVISIITNISLDHTDLLGDSLEKIAAEKAGIIKPNTPVIIGETQEETKFIFTEKAKSENSKIIFADKKHENSKLPNCQLKGIYQQKNIKTVLAAIDELKNSGLKISKSDIKNGLEQVVELTGLMGRWQVTGTNPTVVCDTGHNQGGIGLVIEQIRQQQYNTLHIVFGMVNDKKIDKVLSLLPKEAVYYFTKASLPRALDERLLAEQAKTFGLQSNTYPTVKSALAAARKAATKQDFIYVGGSTFVVAEVL
ncbi:MAG: bifunctional folylpolyglutamate synthase/dihydrofolate synthase [Prevotellaceae bacterium]|jgi:dihydrofolate synthase/folylpolyglutamate synthase|nr:bifunctional folylpolyglutamate synthase/dihydrofolate synthase [Prevotellaceae bacterium]